MKTRKARPAVVRVRVTPSDIRHGHPEDNCACPVARAIRRAIEIPTSVCASLALVDYATPWQTGVWLPDEAVAFIEEFDAGRSVLPFDFDLPFDVQTHLERRAKFESAAR